MTSREEPPAGSGDRELFALQAEAANILGIARWCADDLPGAMAILDEGLALPLPEEGSARRRGELVRFHLLVNRGIVGLSRWWLTGSPDPDLAMGDLARGSDLARERGDRRGLLHAEANRGLGHLLVARKESLRQERDATARSFGAARELLESGLAEADSLSDWWAGSGIRANLALWHLASPAGRRAEGVALAEEAWRRVTTKGGDASADLADEALAGMILARVLASEPNDPAPLERAIALLARSVDLFEKVGFVARAARAEGGRLELAARLGRGEGTERTRFHALCESLDPRLFGKGFPGPFDPMGWPFPCLAEPT
jgi:hypothetical protein